ncbi:MAG: hypothetical protein IJS96_03725 [Schwartzia sp.]|nr:hypothetical protein [Schwartzia sp. (in: firmicutes)]
MATRGKKLLDLALLLLFFAGLLGMFLPRWLHEGLGVLLLAGLLLHLVANEAYFRTLRKNLRGASQRVNLANIVLLAGSVLALALSGAALAGWLPLGAGANWRAWHLGASVAALVLLFLHLLRHGRRYIRGRRFAFLAGAGFLLAAVSFFGLPYLDRWYHTVVVDPAALVEGEKAALPGRVLTVYFSRVGNTNFPEDADAVSGASLMRDEAGELIGNAQMIAAMAQSVAGGDQAAILTAVKYPANYGETTRQAKKELERGTPPSWRVFPRVNPATYDIVILVYPLWWGTMPPAVAAFAAEEALTGKTIIPIVTHGGGGAGDSIADLRQQTKARVEEPLTVYSSDIPVARQAIADYLKKIREKM